MVTVERRFVNALLGHDGNTGKDRTLPWKTLQPFAAMVRARRRIVEGTFLQACATDVTPVTYVLPKLSNIDVDVGAGVDIFGEQFAVLRAATTITTYNPPAGADSSATLVCAGGLGSNTFRGKTVRIKGGNSDGALVTIAKHTDDTITFVRDWLHIYWTIAPGDQFEILEPLVTLDPNPDRAPIFQEIRGSLVAGTSMSGLLLANVRLLPSQFTGALNFQIARSDVALLGVEIPNGVLVRVAGGHFTSDVLFELAAGPGTTNFPNERLPFGAIGTPAHPSHFSPALPKVASIAGWVVGGNCDVESTCGADVSLLGTFHLLNVSAHNEAPSHLGFWGGAVSGGFLAKVGSSIDISANYSRISITGGATPNAAGLDAARGAQINYGGIDFEMASGTPIHAAIDAKILEMASTYGSNTGGTQSGVGAWARWGAAVRFQTAPPFIQGSSGQDLKVGNQAPVASATLAADHGIVDPDGTGARIYVGG